MQSPSPIVTTEKYVVPHVLSPTHPITTYSLPNVGAPCCHLLNFFFFSFFVFMWGLIWADLGLGRYVSAHLRVHEVLVHN
jgi:hypothetical protein